MGVTIHYRGKLADLSQIETIEDHLIDLALELGGGVQVWRSTGDDDPQRMVRGLILDIAPGIEPFCLLFSPEGWLTPLHQIEEAEQGAFAEPPFCFVKTQFGPVTGHVAIVEILAALRDEFIPDLEVSDEGGYWEHRDPARLAAQHEKNAQIIEQFAQRLEEHPLSREAREDPEIVAARIERVAHLVHQAFGKQEPAKGDAEAEPTGENFNTDWRQEEVEWDQLQRKNLASQHRRLRRIEERMQQGESAREAFEASYDEEFPDLKQRLQRHDAEELADEDTFTSKPEEPWLESLPEQVRSEEEPERRDHPLLKRATDFLMRLMDDAKQEDGERAGDIIRHACEICGGLAQALPLPPPYESDFDERGLAVVQLKRALRGAAFVRGACYALPAANSEGIQPKAVIKEIEDIESQIVDLLRQARPMPEE